MKHLVEHNGKFYRFVVAPWATSELGDNHRCQFCAATKWKVGTNMLPTGEGMELHNALASAAEKSGHTYCGKGYWIRDTPAQRKKAVTLLLEKS